jgi:hypothetical protein
MGSVFHAYSAWQAAAKRHLTLQAKQRAATTLYWGWKKKCSRRTPSLIIEKGNRNDTQVFSRTPSAMLFMTRQCLHSVFLRSELTLLSMQKRLPADVSSCTLLLHCFADEESMGSMITSQEV